VSLTIHDVVAAVAATQRSHPDLDIVVADNLPDRPYYRVGATIYINGTLGVNEARRALRNALNELNNDPSRQRHDDAPTGTVIPLNRRTPDTG
jgi:hypothetical protein